MKKHIHMYLAAFAMLISLLLPGCRGAETKGDIGYLADAKFDTDEYLPEYDYVSTRYFFHKMSQVRNSLVYTPDGVEKAMYLRYFDAESGEGGILCNKPECTHSDGLCNGYGDFRYINYYDGSIWWVETQQGDYYLWRADVSGANRCKVLNLKDCEIQRAYVHRGYLYILKTTPLMIDTKPMVRTDLVAYALDGTGGGVTIYSNTDDSFDSLKVCFTGNLIYYYLDLGSINKFKIYCFDTKTRTGGMITTIEKSDECSPNGVYVNHKNEIYLYGKVNKVATVWKYEDGKITELVNFGDPDGNYAVGFMNDGVIGATRMSREPGEDSCWVKKYDGTTVYKLNMVSDYVDNTIKKDYAEARGGRLFACGDENRFYLYGIVSGTNEKSGIHYIVMYEYDGEKIVSRLVDTDAEN